MTKYISLEHAIRIAVSEQNYRKKQIDESVGGGITSDKPVQVANSFYRSVHIEPRKNGETLPVQSSAAGMRKVQKQASSETMTGSMKEEKNREEITNVARPDEDRKEEIVGRPNSDKSKLTKQTEIQRKIIDEAEDVKKALEKINAIADTLKTQAKGPALKLPDVDDHNIEMFKVKKEPKPVKEEKNLIATVKGAIKDKKEKMKGNNPLVDVHPKLNYQQVDQA